MQMQYGSHKLDTAKFPQSTIDALIRRGLSHVLGNEASSKVVAFTEGRSKNGVSFTDQDKAAKKLEFQLAFIASMAEGTLGQSISRGPRVDPVEAAEHAIAKREVIDVLRGAGLKTPKSEAKVKFADGQEYTMDELVERRLAKHGERITREAAKHVADLDRKAKKAKEEAAKAGVVTSEALGL